MIFLSKLFQLLSMKSIPILVSILSSFNYYLDYFSTKFYTTEIPKVYDFIIVGGGSSGSILANRLSKQNTVLLLEAGGDPLILNTVPALTFFLLGHQDLDWGYTTIPQRNACLAFENNGPKLPRGKGLGGTSGINCMFYIKGDKLDYDNWATVTGDPSWSYENLLPYFHKTVDYHGKFKKNEKEYKPTPYGKLHVEQRVWTPMSRSFIEAGKEFGYDEIDLNGEHRSGFGIPEVTQKNGQRWDGYLAFLYEILDRKNLYISRYSQAIKVDLDKRQRAVGVWYVRHGVRMYASVMKEVILSAGSFDTPKLLMLSGIGPSEHLRTMKIRSKVDLPVGQNLQDHTSAIIGPFIMDTPGLTFIPERDMDFSVIKNYITHGTGPITDPASVTALAKISSSKALASRIDWPDVQLYFVPCGVYKELSNILTTTQGYRKKVLDELFQPYFGKDGFLILVTLTRPKSVGEVLLKDKNYASPPIIDPHYLEHPDDLEILIEGIKISMNLVEKSKSYQRLNATYCSKPYSQCLMHPFRSNAYWECYVRHFTISAYHPVGTAKMGYSSDPTAVVDTKLRVRRTRGLRVIDNSIMPVVINANTNAPAVMIGEKGSDIIRTYWAKQLLVCDKYEYLLPNQRKCYYSKLV